MFPNRGNGGRSRGVINVGMVSGGLAWGVEASGAGGEPEGVSGDTSPLGVVDMVVGSNYHKDQRISTRECTSIFGFGSYPLKFSYEIPSKFHQRFPPIFIRRATKFPSFISLHHKISESSDINQDVS